MTSLSLLFLVPWSFLAMCSNHALSAEFLTCVDCIITINTQPEPEDPTPTVCTHWIVGQRHTLLSQITWRSKLTRRNKIPNLRRAVSLFPSSFYSEERRTGGDCFSSSICRQGCRFPRPLAASPATAGGWGNPGSRLACR